jgi:predicted flap endonuclease-1-like 5' DNA nuclease
MLFFLEKTWLWWVLTAVLAALITWLLLRRSVGTAAPSAGPVASSGQSGSSSAPSASPAEPAVNRPVPTPARGLSLRGLVGGDADVAALRSEVDTLRRKADEADFLHTQMVSLRVDADRTKGLEEEVRLLRLRLEGEDGQVAVLKRRIALLEAEASRAADLERELARQGRPSTTRTLGQVVMQAAGLGEESLPPAPVSPAVGLALPDAGKVALAEAPTPDLDAAQRVLGTAVRLDDLQLVEGVGPKIAGLLQDAGVTTWRDLASASSERLRAVLDAAGPRYQVHDPSTWPAQADLLARGEWEQFVALTGSLKGGRA